MRKWTRVAHSKTLDLGLVCLLGVAAGCHGHGDAQERPSETDAAQVTAHDENHDAAEAAEPGDDASDEAPATASASHDAGAAITDASVATVSDTSPSHAADDAGESSPLTIAPERMQTVARDFCKVAFGCDAKMSREVFTNETRCVDDIQSFWLDDLVQIGIDCVEASLAEYSCYASKTCEEQYTACTREEDRSISQCPALD